MAIKRWNGTTNSWEAFGSPQVNIAALGITAESIGAVSKTNGSMTSSSTSLTAVRNMTVSTSAPTSGQGSDGDVWLQYVQD